MYKQNNNTSKKAAAGFPSHTVFIALYVYLLKWDKLVYKVNKLESKQSSKNIVMSYER